MSGYTKGPWHVSGRSKNGEHHLHIGSRYSPMTLASMNRVHLDAPANAILIAAAPDLLEALEIVMDDYEAAVDEWIGDARQNGKERISYARAAIAKAKGGT